MQKVTKVLLCITYCVIIFVFLCNKLHVPAFFNVSSQFMEATRSGLVGHSAVGLVVQGRNTVIILAQLIYGQLTED